MTETYEQPLCAMCDKPSTQLCSGCKSIKYCSIACQKVDWPIHKLICRTYTCFVNSRPDQEHYSMIYFSVNEPRPRFMWIRIDDGHSHPSLEELARQGINLDLSETEGHLAVKAVSVNAALDRPLGPHFINFTPPSAAQTCPCCKGKFTANDSLRGVDAELANTLRGPVLAWAMHREDYRAHKAHPINLAPMDFRHMVDELRFHYSVAIEQFHEVMNEPRASRCVEGVRLNCKGDQQFFHRPHLEPYTVPVAALSDPSLLSSPVADRLGMALHVLEVQPAPLWRDRQLQSRKHNCCSGYINPFANVPDDIGSLIILRKDGGILKPEMLLTFFEHVASKLEYDGTKPPFPLGRLEVFTTDDAREWGMKMRFLETFEIIPDEVGVGIAEQEDNDKMIDA